MALEMNNRKLKLAVAAAMTASCSACVVTQPLLQTSAPTRVTSPTPAPTAKPALTPADVKIEQGSIAGSVTGAAGGAASVDSSVPRCDKTLGTLAIDDGRDAAWSRKFTASTGITNVEPMIRLMVQQSNCFIITTAGNKVVSQNIKEITVINRNGETRMGSNVAPGQRMASDYFLKPEIFLAGDLDDRGGRRQPSLIGALFDSTTATVTLSLVDVRVGTILAASEGSASVKGLQRIVNKDSGPSAYSQTPAGAVTMSAFADAYGKLVIALRNYRAQNVEGGAGTGGRLEVQGK